MRCLSERYASDDFDDSDRRKFLSAVKETVHQATVDKFASIMSTKEFDVCRYLHAVHEINRINQVLTRLNVRVPSETSPEGVLLQFDRLDNSVKLAPRETSSESRAARRRARRQRPSTIRWSIS